MEDGCDGVRGVLIVADGADELTVRTELMRAAMTALDVPASSVEVFARNEE
jgi:stage III sporulation protein AG